MRCLRIDGATPADERQALVRTFQGLPADELEPSAWASEGGSCGYCPSCLRCH